MKVVCAHCALPFSVARVSPGRPVYCCSGCALAARVPVDAKGQFPVNPALVAALGVGFVFFNQALFWLLTILLARSADEASGATNGVVNAARFAWASLAAGAVVVVALGYFQASAGARRAVDGAVWLGAALLLGCGVVNASPAVALAGNAALAAWALRGLGRGRGREKR